MDVQASTQPGEFLFELRPAGALSRLINFLVDVVLAPSLAAWSVDQLGQLWDVQMLSEISSSYSFALVFLLAHYLLGETVFQQTLGKMITRTYVASKNGNSPGFGAVALRTVLRFIPFEPFSIIGRRMWHDSWAGTTVARLPSKDWPLVNSRHSSAATGTGGQAAWPESGQSPERPD